MKNITHTLYVVYNTDKRRKTLPVVQKRNTWGSVKKLAKKLNKSVDKHKSLWYYCKALRKRRAKDLEN